MGITAPILKGRDLREPAILGHYLPWFTRGDAEAFGLEPAEARGIQLPAMEPWRHWRDARSQYRRTHVCQPLWGEYDSRDPHVIRRQIETAAGYGLDGFIVNLYGKNSVENVIGLQFLRELRRYNAAHPEKPFTYTISFDAQAQWASEGKTPVSMEEDFEYIREVWCGEACLRRDGRVPILVFAYDRPCSEYRAAMTKAFGKDGFDLLWLNRPEESAMDGGYPWVRPLQVEPDHRWFSPDDTGADYARQFYAACNENAAVKYLCGGVWPGFNDQFVRWAWSGDPNDARIRPRVICRESTAGSTLELTWQAVVDYGLRHRAGEASARLPLPMVQIVTWNDWAETTQVEPSCDHGYRDLEICRRYSELLKNVNQAN